MANVRPTTNAMNTRIPRVDVKSSSGIHSISERIVGRTTNCHRRVVILTIAHSLMSDATSPVLFNEVGMSRLPKIVTLIACILIALLVLKLFFPTTSSNRLTDIGNVFPAGGRQKHVDAFHPLRNKTMLNAIKGKQWDQLNKDEKTFLIRRWLCKKRNCNLM